MKTKVFCSFIRRRDMDSVLSCLVSDDHGSGNYLEKLLILTKEYFGYEYAGAFRSPVFALGVALDCLGFEKESKIIVSALSPSYYEYVIHSKGFNLLYADVNPDTGQITAEEVTRLVAQGGKALVLHHPLGIMPEISPILETGIPIIEDISHSLGAFSGEVKAGKSGILTMVSLEDGSLVTSSGGTILFANDKRVGNVLKSMIDTLPHEMIMTDMNAALGYTQFKEIEKFLEKRRELYGIFSRQLLQSRHKMLIQSGDGESSYFTFPVVLKSGMKDARTYAKKKDVETEEAFIDTLISVGSIPDTECIHARSLLMRTIVFPLHAGVGKTQTQKIAKVLATLP